MYAQSVRMGLGEGGGGGGGVLLVVLHRINQQDLDSTTMLSVYVLCQL